jgi:hypothetical protein
VAVAARMEVRIVRAMAVMPAIQPGHQALLLG